MRSLAFILCCLHVANLFAAEVLRVGKDQVNIAVTHDEFRKWRVDERVCVYGSDSPDQKIVCGTVLKTTPKGAIVHLENKSNDVSAGNLIKGADETAAPQPASSRKPAAALLSSLPRSEHARPYRFQVGGGGGITASSPFPFPQFQLTLQYTLKPKFALGVSPIYFSAPSATGLSRISALGSFVTLNYYRSEYFRGMWIQGGAGFAMITASDSSTIPTVASETGLAFGGIATVGWRGYWDIGMNVGIAVGAEYLTSPTFTNYVGSAGFIPLVLLDVGFNF